MTRTFKPPPGWPRRGPADSPAPTDGSIRPGQPDRGIGSLSIGEETGDVAAVAPISAPPHSRHRSVVLVAAGLVTGLIVGVGIGAGGSAASLSDDREQVATEGSRLTDLDEELTTRSADLDTRDDDVTEREDAVAAAEDALQATQDEQAALAEQQTALQAQLDQRSADLDGRDAAVTARDTEVAAREAAVATTAEGTTAAPATGSGDAYYANCDAARAAGAAPVQIGQSGYRSGLDRDGDGVGCE